MELSKNDTKVIKGFAIILMVLLHLFCRLDYLHYTPLIYIGSTPLIYYIGLFGDCCVSIYCFCSGYAQYLLADKQGKKYFKGRLKSLLSFIINYEIVVVLFAIIGKIAGSDSVPGSFLKFIKCVFFLSSYNGAWWFVIIYIFLTLFSPILYRIVNKFNWILVLGVTGVLYCISYYFRILNPIGQYFKNGIIGSIATYTVLFFSSLILYIVGMIFYKYKVITYLREKLKYGKNKWLTPVMLLMFVVMIICHGFVPTLAVAPITGLGTVVALSLIKRSKITEKIFLFFGTHSTNIWLIHMFFYLTLFRNFVFIAKYPILIVVLMFAICIAVSYVINFVLKFLNGLIFPDKSKN